MMWFALDVTLTARAREAVEYALMEAGALGTESDAPAARAPEDSCAHVSGYFDSPPEIERVRAALLDALRIYGLASSDVRELTPREVEARDWLGEWKKSWRPVEVGRFVVAPPWSEVEETAARIVIRVEPGMAFGTGTHETTRLCLAAIEKHFRGRSFLDVGTGTGVLAIAAAKLSPSARIEACDTDAVAVEVAEENARRNGVGDRIEFRVGTVDDSTASADVTCANLTADVIVPLLPALLGATCGRLILSGILDVQAEEVRARLHALGVSDYEITSDGEWVALTI
ncbi:MAG TPA: 50S ribosomal protein L11 methyltransferase [Pyrinomonadaceae bacterium]|nr:50S ribosomal protein L11 methyltransferase [Pyrinomonadaceae bacterium]